MQKQIVLSLADSICDLRSRKIKRTFFTQINTLLDWESISKLISAWTCNKKLDNNWKVNRANKKVLKISLRSKRRPWIEGIFLQTNNVSPPFQYSNE